MALKYIQCFCTYEFSLLVECEGSDSCPETPPDLSISSVPLTPTPSPASPQFTPVVDIDQQTDSNHDTALTLAAAGGHDELVQLLLTKGSAIEHRDKKGEQVHMLGLFVCLFVYLIITKNEMNILQSTYLLPHTWLKLPIKVYFRSC